MIDDAQPWAAPHPAYPLTVAPNNRNLVDRTGVPVLLQGDAAWSIIAGLTEAEAALYLDDRERKGFNTILVNLIEHVHRGPVNRYGEGPFTVPGDFSTPNEAYFSHADRVIDMAAERGIQVLLTPLYLGYDSPGNDEGWIAETLHNGVEACRAYGRYVGKRYAGCDNLIWVIGGDRNPGAAVEHASALVAGIREYDDRHLFTAHCAPESSPVEQYPGGWLNLNNTYTYEIVHRKLLADFRRRPVMPFFLMESTYEGEHNASTVQVRRQAYWAMLCGAAGQVFGNNPIWKFGSGWEAALESPGSHGMVHLRRLFESRPWYDLVPDLDGVYTFRPDLREALVTEGRGEFRGLDYLAAAQTPDGSTAIAYMPTARGVTLNLARMSGHTARVWWFDPRTGGSSRAGDLPTTGMHPLDPPGDGDWVIVLDDISKNLAAPGT